jgi:predicted nucleic acid-binding protein
VILLDTSVLIQSLTRDRPAFSDLTRLLERGEIAGFCTIVLYEWLRGPRLPMELATQEALFPGDAALPFEAADARISAELYRAVTGARSREADIAIAACAIRRDAELWTLNRADFADIPRLRLARP